MRICKVFFFSSFVSRCKTNHTRKKMICNKNVQMTNQEEKKNLISWNCICNNSPTPPAPTTTNLYSIFVCVLCLFKKKIKKKLFLGFYLFTDKCIDIEFFNCGLRFFFSRPIFVSTPLVLRIFYFFFSFNIVYTSDNIVVKLCTSSSSFSTFFLLLLILFTTKTTKKYGTNLDANCIKKKTTIFFFFCFFFSLLLLLCWANLFFLVYNCRLENDCTNSISSSKQQQSIV